MTAVAILLPIDSLSGEISSGVIQTLASKPVDRAAIIVGKWLAYFGMTAAYLALMAGGVVLSMRLFADYQAPTMLVPMGLMLLGAAVMLWITDHQRRAIHHHYERHCGVRVLRHRVHRGLIDQFLSLFQNSTARYVGTVVSLLTSGTPCGGAQPTRCNPCGHGRFSERPVRCGLGAERRDDSLGHLVRRRRAGVRERGCSAAGRCDAPVKALQ